MKRDRKQGEKEQVVGSMKEAIGKITGDEAMTSEGRADQASGTAKISGDVGSKLSSKRSID